MVRSSVILAATLALRSELHAQAPVQFTVSDHASCLHVRSSPKSSAPSFVCLAPGTVVDAIGTAPYWRQIRLDDGRTGWAAKKFLELVTTPPDAPGTEERDDAWLEVHVVDVGQGDGIWIHTFDDNIPGNGRYEGYNIVVDGGPDARGPKNQLLRYLLERAHPGAVIDALIITHPHDDHYPGAQGLLERFEVREFYEPGRLNTNDWLQFRALLYGERAGGESILRHVGRDSLGTPDWGSELSVRFLYADPRWPTGLGSGGTRINNSSIVFRLEYGSQSILFMGDAEGKERDNPPDSARYVERFLLDSVDPAALRSTVLKVAHHGSETSSTIPFIEAVDPRHVIVSSGRRRYGPRFLPDRSTLERYCTHSDSIRIYRTDQDDESEGRTAADDADGDHIVISTNGQETRVQAYSAGNPITPTACVP